MRVALALCAALSLLPLASAGTEIWRGVDRDGNVIYSDQPIPGGRRLPPLEVQTLPALKPPPPREPLPIDAAPVSGYELVDILTPDRDATVRDNAGVVLVRVAVVPNLDADAGHRVELLLDGQRTGEPRTATTFTLQDVTRGTHQLQVRIIARDGGVLLTSAPVTFHLQRASAVLP